MDNGFNIEDIKIEDQDLPKLDLSEFVEEDTEITVENELEDTLAGDPATQSSTGVKPNGRPTNIYKELYKEITDEEIEDEIEDSETLKEKLKAKRAQEVKQELENFKKTLSPQAKLFLDFREYFDEDTQAIALVEDLEYYDSLKEEIIEDDVEVQKDLMMRLYMAQGKTKEQAEEEIDDDIALGKLEERAKKAAPALKSAVSNFLTKKKETVEKQKTSDLEEEKARFTKIVETVDKADNIGGLKINDKHKKGIKESMSKVVYEDPKTGKKYNDIAYKQLKHPETMEIAMNFMNALGLLNINDKGDYVPDLSKLSGLTSKQVSSKLDALIQESQRTGRIPSATKYSDSELEEQFKKELEDFSKFKIDL